MKKEDDNKKINNNSNSSPNKNILVEEDEKDIELGIVKSNKNEDEKKNDNQINNQAITLQIQNKIHNKNEKESNNYFLLSFKKNIKRNICFLLSIIIIIILENNYRESLFNYSIPYEVKLQKSLSKNAITFYFIISLLGGGILIGVGIFYAFLFFPLIKWIMLTSALLFIIYFHCVQKMWYGNPRPFWINNILYQKDCQTGFGNPSGHSFISFFFYPSLCYLIINHNQKNKTNFSNTIIIYLSGFFFAALVAYSRLVLGVHSINQVLYGGFFGLWFFIILTFAFKIYEMPISYYLKFYKEKTKIILTSFSLLFLFLFALVIYFLFKEDPQQEKYKKNIVEKCTKIKIYRLFKNEGIHGSLIIMFLFGMYLGQFLFWFLVEIKRNRSFDSSQNGSSDEEYIRAIDESFNHWNKYRKDLYEPSKILKSIGMFLICLIPGVFHIIFPYENTPLFNVYLIKISLPFFLFGFLGSGPCLFSFLHMLLIDKGVFLK